MRSQCSTIHRTVIICFIISFLMNLIVIFSAQAKTGIKYLKMASLAPKNVGWARNIRNIMHPALDRITHGKLKLKWFWGGIMGDDKDYIEKMKSGKLDGAALTSYGMILACPEMAVLELPFLFNNYDEVDYIREKMWKEFDVIAEKNGFKMLIWADQDFDQIYSVNYRMNQWTDFQQAKIIQWNGIVEKKTFEALHLSFVSLRVSEIYPAIQQNIANTYIGPAIWTVGSQLYPIFKHVNPIKLRYSPAGALITLDVWNSLPKHYRDAWEDIRKKEGNLFCHKTRKDSDKAFQAMEKYGMQVSTTDSATIKILKEQSLPLRKQLAGTLYSQAILDELLKHLSEFRSKETE
ncbi:MAG: TRAP transporter substrate-binding protein DctP [Candidatus Magnetomorum sp.]|nr:TRAP transporter substrate-binding protein DctP [Candidatus Magnetomorum sp.]